MCAQTAEPPRGPWLLPPDLAAELARLAHEVRAPLTTMHTTVELLSEDYERLEPAQVRQLVAILHRSTRWLEGLVDTLPDLAPAPRPDGAGQRVRVCLRGVLDDILPLLQPALAAQRQPLTIAEPERLPAVLANPQQLGQVYVNLLTNASKFAAPGTPLGVQFTLQDEAIRVAIADRGPGIPAAALPRLFEPYYQAPSVTATPGVGLGLAIVQRIIAAHGGQVGAENRRGGGARVCFSLPRTE